MAEEFGGLVSDDDWWSSDYFDAEDYANVHTDDTPSNDFTWGGGQSMWNAPTSTDSFQTNKLNNYGDSGGLTNLMGAPNVEPNQVGLMGGIPTTLEEKVSFLNSQRANIRNDVPTLDPIDVTKPLAFKNEVRVADTFDNKMARLNKRFGNFLGDAVKGTVGGPAIDAYRNLSRVSESTIPFDKNQPVVNQMNPNFGSSVAKEFKGVLDMAIKPIETGAAAINLASGALQHLVPDTLAWNQVDKDMASSVGQAVSLKYGSVDGWKKALSEDPVEAIALLSGVGLLSKGLLGKVADPSTVDKVAGKFGITPEPKFNIAPVGKPLYTGPNPLIAQHNLTESSLLKQIKGMPMPSFAISKVNNPMTNFGEITILVDPSDITPGRDVNVHSSDIYSGRQPNSRREYTDLKTLKEGIPQETLDFYGYYTVDNLTPGGLEAKVAVTPVYEDLGYKTSDFDSFALMRREAEMDGHYVPEPHITPEQYLGDVRHAIPNPKGQFTPTGKQRPTVEWTPEAAHKAMKAKKAWIPGTEGLVGSGQARALTAKQFKTLNAIKKSRDEIVDNYSFDPLSGEEDFKSFFTGHYDDALSDIERMGAKLDEGYMPSFRYEEMIEESLKGADLSWTGWNKESISKVKDITNQLQDIAEDLPTDYFEAKRKDIYDFSKAKGAIIPEHAKEAEKLLRSKGIEKIYTYGTEAERKSLFKKFPELYFHESPTDYMGYGEPEGMGLL